MIFCCSWIFKPKKAWCKAATTTAATTVYYNWETGKSVVVGVFLWGALLSGKWLQTMESDMVNYQKRYLAISWNTIGSFMFAARLGIVSFPNSRQSQSDTRSDTLEVPFWYINAHRFILFPHFPLVKFQLWTRKKRSGDVRHTWPALSKNPKYQPVTMNTDNFNSTIVYHTYMPQTL